jgi:hypothetical protein
MFDTGNRFNPALMRIDSITDFTRREDKIVLNRSTFTDLRRGRISFARVGSLRQAQRSTKQVVYVRQTGSIFCNQNGSAVGFSSGGQFADIANGLNLNRQDFIVVN